MRDDKNGLSHVFVAMGAIAFFVAAVPALDAFSTWIANYFGLKSVKLNQEASELVGEDEEGNEQSHCIGFQVPSESEEDEEYYDE